MRILLCSVPYSPGVGGIETVSAILADRFTAMGHEVCVVTRTASNSPDVGHVRIIREPSARALCRAVRWADVVFHNNISLRFAWPLLLYRRPWVVAHHIWLSTSGIGGILGRLKRAAMQGATHIAVSDAIAHALPVASVRVPNPYASELFVTHPGAARSGDLVFVGRLVRDKGVDVLLDALSLLRARHVEPSLTVIGSGPESAPLAARVRALGLDSQVRFAGVLRGTELVAALNRHRVLVVPSTWEEPFGVVALEALACGVVPLVTRSGGLPDAVGACGCIVPKADAPALAAAIDRLLSDDALRGQLRSGVAQHLARHTPDEVARAYIEVLTRAAAGTETAACAS